MKTGELERVNVDVERTVRITTEEVLDILRRMKVDKPSGSDKIYPAYGKLEKKIAGTLSEIYEPLEAG